jgi:hypothetical protein
VASVRSPAENARYWLLSSVTTPGITMSTAKIATAYPAAPRDDAAMRSDDGVTRDAPPA